MSEMKQERYNDKFLEAMTWLFNPKSELHRSYFQMTVEDMDKVRTGRETWRESLKAGDRVDVRIPLDDKKQQMGWVQARIELITENLDSELNDEENGRYLTLICPELPASYDIIKDKWSTDVA